MNTTLLKPRKALNKALLKVKPKRSDIEAFKENLISLLDSMDDRESEEFHKNLVADFLRDTYYKNRHFINTKGRNDQVIHNGPQASSSVGVIIEAKKPGNRSEMVTADRLNTKAFHELVLYYLRERITHKNLEVKHLVATNINEWFIFDAVTFDRLFAQNKALVETFIDFEGGRLSDTKTDFFYKQIAEPFIAGITSDIEFTYFNLQEYQKPLRNADKEDDTKLIALYKILSPEHLLKQPLANDGNSLNRHFYSELLHIIGLTEIKDGGKKLIQRNKDGERNSGSLLEAAIIQLDSLDKISRLPNPGQYGANYQERLFNVGLELTITWMNRILFLKLLEAQLLTYHKGDKSYSFLNLSKINDYDDLQKLFFQVLARRHEDRHEDVKRAFAKVPYLNSSLFEPTDIEHATLMISNLSDGRTIPIISSTVLKTEHGKKRTGELPTLEYLFAFLDAYDFSSEGSDEIQEDSKTLINASVLGLIFEKINGYKDGSFFTPSFITMYMCRETIRKAIVQKFNEVKGWSCASIDDLYDKIDDRREANEIVNRITICDPAVGSGHFLVSALNELIAVKSDLNILMDADGRRLKEYQVDVVNDELIVTDEDGELFDYHPHNKESQHVQVALFHEKQTLIENCLFGVDINPNSVKICRLRLWIELLKNAYYKNETELETLPNIDINIKCGNSLVSRFALDADLKQALVETGVTIEQYRNAISTYHNAENKEEKRRMEELIQKVKTSFVAHIPTDFNKKLSAARGKAQNLANEIAVRKQWNEKIPAKDLKELEVAEAALLKLLAEKEEIETNQIYVNAFEWRFEFPEVLSDDGSFIGFDVVIGNPPYIRQEEIKEFKPFFEQRYETYAGTADLYVFFVEQGMRILRDGGEFSYIIPNKWLRANYGQFLRRYLKRHHLQSIVDFGDLPVFEEAITYPIVIRLSKSEPAMRLSAAQPNTLDFGGASLSEYLKPFWTEIVIDRLLDSGWSLAGGATQDLFDELRRTGIPLGDYVNGRIYYGIKTGLNEAFVINRATRDQIIEEDSMSEEVLRPFLAGRDIKRGVKPIAEKFLIRIRNGDTRLWFGNGLTEESALEAISQKYPAIMRHLKPFAEDARHRGDKGQYWWELRPCEYYDAFDKPKIIYPDMAPQPNFVFVKEPMCLANTAYFFNVEDDSLVDYLNSDLIAEYMGSVAPANRGGYRRYFTEYVSRIPIKNNKY